MSVIVHLLPANTKTLKLWQPTCFSWVLLPRVKKSHQAGMYIFSTCTVNSFLWRHGVTGGPLSNLFDLTRSSSPRHELPPPFSYTGLHLYKIQQCKTKPGKGYRYDRYLVHPGESRTRAWRLRVPTCDYLKVGDWCFMILLWGHCLTVTVWLLITFAL